MLSRAVAAEVNSSRWSLSINPTRHAVPARRRINASGLPTSVDALKTAAAVSFSSLSSSSNPLSNARAKSKGHLWQRLQTAPEN